MLDLVLLENGSPRLDLDAETAKFLEPACCDGNFITEILARKCHAIGESRSAAHDASIRILRALATITGIDISDANVTDCHHRMMVHAIGWHRYLTGSEPSQAWAWGMCAYETLRHKIVIGDFLSDPTVFEVTVLDDLQLIITPRRINTTRSRRPAGSRSSKRKLP